MTAFFSPKGREQIIVEDSTDFGEAIYGVITLSEYVTYCIKNTVDMGVVSLRVDAHTTADIKPATPNAMLTSSEDNYVMFGGEGEVLLGGVTVQTTGVNSKAFG